MKVRRFLKGRWLTYSLIVGALVSLLLLTFLPGCVPAGEEEIPPVEEEAPPAEEVGPYEEYVSSLPEGCLPVPRDCFEQAQEEGVLNFYTWAEWYPREWYEDFFKTTGIRVVEDGFADQDEHLTKFKLNPETPYDVSTPNPRIIMQFKELGVVQKINHDWIPNVNKYLTEDAKNIPYVENYQYAVPYYLYFTCWVYNGKYVDDARIPSWKVLFEPDEKYKGRITMLNDMFETIGAALEYCGYEWSSDNEGELMEAREALLQQKPSLLAYDSAPRRLALEEEAWIVHLWTGDAWWWHFDLPTLEVALPPEGSFVGTDNYSIPIGSKHPAAAHMWINYMFRPDVNAEMNEAFGYTPCHTAVPEMLPKELRDWPGVVPSKELLARSHWLEERAFTGRGLELRSQIWEELKM